MNKPLLALYRQRCRDLLQQARVAWRGLSLREQRLLGASMTLLLGLAVGLLWVQPALQTIDHWQAETPKLRSQAQALDALLQEQSGAGQAQGEDLEQALRRTLDEAGLKDHYQLQAADPATWQLSFTQAPADAVVGWLLGWPRQFSLRVVQAQLQRAAGADTQDSAGTLSGTVRMDHTLNAKEAS
ncbi:type II secretion system protein M [Pseudomonas sp. MAFF 302030]|jgi:general secretion pathway protein M|uniref:Type II secretion system protein M n=1 Tax=Pseudomonas morbosilactucae TaxID=2938197 RepID=A0A9X1YZP8_9PSED|nr:type II secretion system protein GspM [Pseudomonas morbosilactucae]MCK9801087.1 type II secretion system protein M [Pseudomonas morbosilactucae]MCK9818330.1 type II secretion system protein M [Pseudomonas morbosilactucae]